MLLEGILPILLGLISAVLPGAESSLGIVWGIAAMVWGLAFIVVTEVATIKSMFYPSLSLFILSRK